MAADEPAWEVVLTPTARRSLNTVPDRYLVAVIETIDALQHDPITMGGALFGELEGLRSARRGPYRVLYEVDERGRRVTVHRVGHRADVYGQPPP